MTSRILHISGDYPDPIEPFKTPVIKSFLDLTEDDFDHRVVSINRRTPSPSALFEGFAPRSDRKGPVHRVQTFERGVALEYLAPPSGIFHRTMLERLGEYLAELIRSQSEPPHLLVGHKLTIEGIAVAKASALTGIPYALTIQGNTDRRILKARPDLGKNFRTIYQNAQMVCTFTPIARGAIEAMLGKRKDGIHLIPCPTELDQIIEPHITGGDIISVFHLKNHKVKNLDGLASAARLLARDAGKRSIAILGGGSEAELAKCKTIAADASQIRFDGPVDRDAMQKRMNGACALVVPSRAESFGLVFVEALFAGLPIIYPKGTAIDGYFDALPFAQGVDAGSPEAIAEAMQRAVDEEESMKRALHDWQKSGALEQFTRRAIAQNYSAALSAAVPG
ncbi:glycosyltransferase [Qipengyuania sp. S6317L1]|uniref:glycosyltransferase n=1 Tax=Qipengyuania sp. S6317L1 TaxID=2926410 RepID=UPI001FF1EB53|nr:glycosyltransferase [Qipengyuania sp. S6317L1]MCK0098752.1 glycosyltransferase [Qipengyuania sp. S6317L1]